VTPADHAASDEPFNVERLKLLVSACCDGALAPAEHHELEQMLRDHREARVHYAAYLQTDAALDWKIRGREKLAGLGRMWSADDAPHSCPATPTSQAPLPARLPARARAAALAVAVSLLAALGVVFWTTSRTAPSSPSAAVAKIAELSEECHWFVENRPDSQNVARAGDTIRLTRGRLQLEFSCGATVTLKSPAALQVISPMHARAMLGALTAHVGEGAEGFTIDTPRTTVVDLGTDFGINVSDHGSTDVVVFNGEVDLHYDSAQGSRSRQRLRVGEGVRVSGEGATSRINSINDSQYPVAAAAAKREPVISAVTDNIRGGESWHYYEIVHGGMREDAKAFVDRNHHEWNGLVSAGMPSYLLGGDYVKTFNDDKKNSSAEIKLTIDRPAILYVLHDNRSPVPQWLADRFLDTGDDIGIDGGGYSRNHLYRTNDVGPGVSIEDYFSVWRCDVPRAGTVELGAIPIGGAENNMYGIVAVPMQLGSGRDDFPGELERPSLAAAVLPKTANGLAIDGAISLPGDADAFKAPWTGGMMQATCRVSPQATLDPVLSVYDRNDMLVGRARAHRTRDTSASVAMNLPPGDYYCVVTGGDEVGEVGEYQLELAATTDATAPAPQAPSPSLALRATPQADSITLQWSEIPGVNAYSVERSLDGVDFQTLATTSAASWTDTDIAPGIDAVYRLRAGKGAEGHVSAPLCVRPRPEAVESLLACGRQPRLIALQWRDGVGEQAYRVERSTDGRRFAAVAMTAANACGFRDASVDSQSHYYYRIVSVDSLGDAAVSPVVEAVASIRNLTASAVADGAVALRWKSNHPAGRLLVERALGETGAFRALALLPGDVEDFQDNSAPPGQRVAYRVSTVADANNLHETAAYRTDSIRLPLAGCADHFALRFSGQLRVENAGRYEFTLNTDDGSRLFIDDQLIVDHDGLHGLSEQTGAVELAASDHRFELQYFQRQGPAGLEVWWTGPGIPKDELPQSALTLIVRRFEGVWTRLPFASVLAVSPAVYAMAATNSSQ
jgi:ferric-dicitrate binding protein FerR (iron transport regulator)